MRLWKCDKCGKIEEGQYKPKNFVDVKIYFKAQSKGGESSGCHLCMKCTKIFFKSVRTRKITALTDKDGERE